MVLDREITVNLEWMYFDYPDFTMNLKIGAIIYFSYFLRNVFPGLKEVEHGWFLITLFLFEPMHGYNSHFTRDCFFYNFDEIQYTFMRYNHFELLIIFFKK